MPWEPLSSLAAVAKLVGIIGSEVSIAPEVQLGEKRKWLIRRVPQGPQESKPPLHLSEVTLTRALLAVSWAFRYSVIWKEGGEKGTLGRGNLSTAIVTLRLHRTRTIQGCPPDPTFSQSSTSARLYGLCVVSLKLHWCCHQPERALLWYRASSPATLSERPQMTPCEASCARPFTPFTALQ